MDLTRRQEMAAGGTAANDDVRAIVLTQLVRAQGKYKLPSSINYLTASDVFSINAYLSSFALFLPPDDPREHALVVFVKNHFRRDEVRRTMQIF